MAGVKTPCWDLAPAALAQGKGVGMFLQDPDPIPPVLAAKVQTQAIARVGGPHEVGKGAGESLR